jgi:hypothetical protein
LRQVWWCRLKGVRIGFPVDEGLWTQIYGQGLLCSAQDGDRPSVDQHS